MLYRMELILREVKEGTEDFEYVTDLYYFSFPDDHSDTMDKLVRATRYDLCDFYIACDGDVRVGLLCTIHDKGLVFIYYLAVDPGMRGKG